MKALYKHGIKCYQRERKEYYITSTGTQYINTEIKPDATTTLEIKARGIFLTYYSSMFGTSGLDNTQRFSVMSSTDGMAQRFDYGNHWGMPFLSQAPFLSDEPFIMRKNGTANIYNGVTVSTNNIAVFDPEKTTNIYLFACHEAGKASYNARMELYYCKIMKSSVLVFDAIAVPVGVTIDGKVSPANCLYDKISKNFFLNAGTGNFGIGQVN